MKTPPFLYLPCSEASDGSLELEYRTTRKGQTALIAYTALDLLHAGCGHGQPWTVLTAEQLELVLDEHPADLIVTDITKPQDQQIPGDAPPPGTLPPLGFAPCLQHVDRVDDATITYLRAEDGTTLFPIYSSVERLDGALGQGHPWIVIDTRRLAELRAIAPFDEVLLDHEIDVRGVEGEGL